MARSTDVNNTFTTAGDPLYRLKTVLKSAGWTVLKSSDGISYNASGDQITHGGTGAGGYGNPRAWACLQDPGGRRQLCLQLMTNGLASGSHWRFTMSEAAGFVAGAPAITVVPSASDSQIMCGSGTDAAPVGATIIPAVASTFRIHIWAESVPVGNVFGFGFVCTSVGAATQTNGTFFCEPMAPGSYRAGDVAPCVWYCSSSALPINASTLMGWFAYGLANQAWATTISVDPGWYNGALGVNLVDAADDNGYPSYAATVTGSIRIKGVGSAIAVKGPARTYPATANTASDAKVYLGSWCYPYANNTVPSVS